MDRRTIVRQSSDSCKDIEQNIFKHHNYDGVSIQSDLAEIDAYQRARKAARKSTPIWLTIGGISAYNISRFGVLSKTGQAGAMLGLLCGSWMTYSTLTV